MNRWPVQSSNIKAIGHDPQTNTMDVEFSSGKVYRYSEVNADEHMALIRAKSVGSHFANVIRPNKQGTEVQP